jgi:hypothetical protein
MAVRLKHEGQMAVVQVVNEAGAVDVTDPFPDSESPEQFRRVVERFLAEGYHEETHIPPSLLEF